MKRLRRKLKWWFGRWHTHTGVRDQAPRMLLHHHIFIRKHMHEWWEAAMGKHDG